VERVSRISTATQTIIHDRWQHLLCWDAERLTPERLVKHTQAIEQKGAPIGTVWAFIDGTIRGIAGANVIYRVPAQYPDAAHHGNH